MTRKSNYELLAVAKVGDDRIERLLVKDAGTEEIRFSWWKDGAFKQRPLVITEDELLDLMREAVHSPVFKPEFTRRLRDVLIAACKE